MFMGQRSMHRDPTVRASAGTLAVLSAMHGAWAAGSSFPAKDRRQLAQMVAGTDGAPSAAACLGVSGALGLAAALVADVAGLPRCFRISGVTVVAATMALRGITGISGQTHRLVPWTPGERFVELDRKYYGPLCLALAAGSLRSLRS